MSSVKVAGSLMERIARKLDHSVDDYAYTRSRLAAVHYFVDVAIPEALGLAAAAGSGAEMLYRVPAENLA
jgi:hypothetical protein